jgi:hypothetical protein
LERRAAVSGDAAARLHLHDNKVMTVGVSDDSFYMCNKIRFHVDTPSISFAMTQVKHRKITAVNLVMFSQAIGGIYRTNSSINDDKTLYTKGLGVLIGIL